MKKNNFIISLCLTILLSSLQVFAFEKAIPRDKNNPKTVHTNIIQNQF